MKNLKRKSISLAIAIILLAAVFIPASVKAIVAGYKNTFAEGATGSETVAESTNMTEYINGKKAAFENALAEAGVANPNFSSIDYNTLFSIEEGSYKYATMENCVLEPEYLTIDGNQYREYTITYNSYTVTKSAQINQTVPVHTVFFGVGGAYTANYETDDPQEQAKVGAALTASGFFEVPTGNQITLTARATEGYTFDGWYEVHEVDTDGQGNMEWVRDNKVSINSVYSFVPSGFPYLEPVFTAGDEEEVSTINTLNINVKKPKIGDTVIVEEKVDPDWGFVYYESSIEPTVTLENGANYGLDWKAYIKGFPSEIPEGYDEPFEGTFEADKYYYVEVSLVANEGYGFASNENMTLTVNGETTNYELGGWNMDNSPYFLFYVKLKATDVDEQLYELSSGDYSVSFTDDAGYNYELVMMDVLTLSKDELAQLEVTEEEFNEIYKLIKENTEQYGTLLSVFAIEVQDGDHKYTGPVNIKIKLTEELKKYNSFKMIYLDDENNFKVGEIVELKVEGDYLVGTLPHLSAYTLVGNVEEEEDPNTPKAGDTIMLWNFIIIAAIAGFVVIKKRNTK